MVKRGYEWGTRKDEVWVACCLMSENRGKVGWCTGGNPTLRFQGVA